MTHQTPSSVSSESQLLQLLKTIPSIDNIYEIAEKLRAYGIYTIKQLSEIEAVDLVDGTGLDVSTCSQLVEKSRTWSASPQAIQQQNEIKFSGSVKGVFTLSRSGDYADGRKWISKRFGQNQNQTLDFRPPPPPNKANNTNNNTNNTNTLPHRHSISSVTPSRVQVPLRDVKIDFLRIVSKKTNIGDQWFYQILVGHYFTSKRHDLKLTLKQLQELHHYLVEKYQNFNFEPFPIVSPLFEPDKAELERHKPTLQKYFDTVCKSGEIVNDPHFRELFNLTNDILPSAVSEESQKLVQALTVMCSQMESTENTMISLFTNQIDDIVLETNPYLVEAQTQLKSDISEYTEITTATIKYTVTYRVFLYHCAELLKIASNALKEHDRQGFRTPILRMIEETQKSHQSAVDLVEQLKQFIVKVKSNLDDIKSQKTILTHKKNALLCGGISAIVVSSVLSIPLLAITAPRATAMYGMNKSVDVKDFFPLIKFAYQILKKGGFDQMKEALKKIKDFIEIYENALDKIKQQQTHFTNLQSALSEVNAKCSDLDILKDDDFEFLKMEFPIKFGEVQKKLLGLYNSVEKYLHFLKDKGLIEQIPEVPPFRLT